MMKTRRGAWKLLRKTENPAITHFKSNMEPQRAPGYLLSNPKQ